MEYNGSEVHELIGSAVILQIHIVMRKECCDNNTQYLVHDALTTIIYSNLKSTLLYRLTTTHIIDS